MSDGHGSTDTATVTVTITGVNDQVDAVDDAHSVNEDATTANLAASLLSNDTDPDTSDVIRITGVTQGAKGSVVFNDGGTAPNPADDTLTYKADGAVLDALAAGESTTDTFTYTVSDGHGSTDTATVTVTINGVNDQVDAVDDADLGERGRDDGEPCGEPAVERQRPGHERRDPDHGRDAGGEGLGGVQRRRHGDEPGRRHADLQGGRRGAGRAGGWRVDHRHVQLHGVGRPRLDRHGDRDGDNQRRERPG